MLELPDELIDLILEYLPVSDLLNASNVCKKWYEHIGNSHVFMKKIIVNSSHDSIPEISCKRNYKSLNVKQFKMKREVKNLFKDHEWRKVNFNVVKISSQDNFVSIMRKLRHVEELRVYNVSITKLNDHKKLILPELASLTFSDVAVDTFETFMAHQPSLKLLSLKFISCDIANPISVEQYFIEFLILNSHIKELELYCDVVNNLFKLNVTNFLPLKLHGMSLNFCDTNDNVTQNVNEFLKSQQGSLEDLNLIFSRKSQERRESHRYMYDEVEVYFINNDPGECKDISVLLNVWNNLSNLKKLTLRFLNNFTETEVSMTMIKNYKANNNIEFINIKHIGCTIPSKIIQMIVKLCPNLVHLYISVLNKNLILFCAMNSKLLRSISYTIDADNAINQYSEIIKSNDNDINKFIKFHKEYNG